MPLFTSSREKRFWLFALMVMAAIFATLALGRPLQEMLRDQNIQAIFFVLGMIMTGVAILLHGIRLPSSKTELAIWFGLAAVYIMFIFRLGAPERSHLIEYSVLAIFIHKALIERISLKDQVLKQGLIALAITALIGFIDEGIQLFLPNRVFDPTDMLFNSLAALMAIGGSMALQWARKKFRKQ